MSTNLTALVWEIKFPTHTQKLIMLRLADYANNNGESIFPSIQHLADSANCKKRIVQYALAALEDVGLTIRDHEGGKGAGDTSRWRLDIDLICKLAAQDVILEGTYCGLEVVENKGANIAPSQMGRVQRATIRVQPTTNKDAKDCTQSLRNLKDPSSAPADAPESDGLGCGKVKGEDLAAIHITDHEMAWEAWLDELKARGEYELAEKAERAGSMIVGSRWPNKNSKLPVVPPDPPSVAAKKASKKKAEAITGEAP